MAKAWKSLLVCVVVIVLLAVGIAPLDAAANHEESVTGTATTSLLVSSASLAGTGTDELYVAAIFITGNVDVLSVIGGGLAWTERRQQCNGNGGRGLSVFTAFGSPIAAFSATANFASLADASVIVLSRYSGVDTTTPFEDVTGENTVGENDATCTGGSANTTAQLTLTSSIDKSILYAATNSETKAISTADADYAERGAASAGNDGDKTNGYVHDRTLATAGTDTVTHSVANPGSPWATVGLVIRPGGVFSESPTETAALGDSYTLDIGVPRDSLTTLGYAARLDASIARSSITNLVDAFRLNQGVSQFDTSSISVTDMFLMNYGQSRSDISTASLGDSAEYTVQINPIIPGPTPTPSLPDDDSDNGSGYELPAPPPTPSPMRDPLPAPTKEVSPTLQPIIATPLPTARAIPTQKASETPSQPITGPLTATITSTVGISVTITPEPKPEESGIAIQPVTGQLSETQTPPVMTSPPTDEKIVFVPFMIAGSVAIAALAAVMALGFTEPGTAFRRQLMDAIRGAWRLSIRR